MAFHAENLNQPKNLTWAGRAQSAVSGFFYKLMDAQTRTNEVRRMQSLSDAELQTLGLRRDQIVRQVYRDVYYV